MKTITEDLKHQITVIDGLYSPADAGDKILSVINREIEFINIKNLNALDSCLFNKTDYEEQLNQLKSAREEIKKALNEVKTADHTIQISTKIEIKLIH